MTPLESYILSATILLPFTMILLRLKQIHWSYFPFSFLLILGVITELINFFIVNDFGSTFIVFNIYLLLETVIVLFQFCAWGFLRKKPTLFGILLAFYISFWIIENFVWNDISTEWCSRFVVLFSSTIVLLSIHQMNSIIVSYSGSLFTNSCFLICTTFIITGIYGLITEGVMMIDPRYSSITKEIYPYFIYINAFINIIYAFAVYYIPVRESYYFKERFQNRKS
jgi:hypothetical protein